jgi:hypothetical protein
MTTRTLQIGKTFIELTGADPIHLPSPADCNSPCWWSADGFHLLTSTGHPIHSCGADLEHLQRQGEVIFTAWRDGGHWIESVHQEANGWLLGWYHNEPTHYIPAEYQVGRQFPLTAPFIGAVISYDNGLSWDDLGLVLTGASDTLSLPEHNFWFAGGNGDFRSSWINPAHISTFFSVLITMKSPSRGFHWRACATRTASARWGKSRNGTRAPGRKMG